MLTIRAKQMEAFQQYSDERFINRVADYLRTENADLVADIPLNALCEMVRIGIAKGRKWGLSWQSSLTIFVMLMLQIGPDFDQHDAFREALEVYAPDEDQRILAVYERVTDEEWDEACRQSDPTAWAVKNSRGL